jgi:hypothetical protein
MHIGGAVTCSIGGNSTASIYLNYVSYVGHSE